MSYIWLKLDLINSSWSVRSDSVDVPHCINHLSSAVSWSVSLPGSFYSHHEFVLLLPDESCVLLSSWGVPSGNRDLRSSSLGEADVGVVLDIGGSDSSCQFPST